MSFAHRGSSIRIISARVTTRREREHMKKMPTRVETDEMRPEYDFDYSKARPNPYAARLKGHSVAVLLAPDVAPSFPTADSVNDILRAVIKAVPRPRRRPARLKAQHPRKAG